MADPIALLQNRHRLLQQVRGVFLQRGFLEVSTPVLQEAPTPEPYIGNFETSFSGPLGEGPQMVWLHSSPELDMKRLLAEGADRIFQLAPVFRQGDRSPLHTPEFTMLEWYETGAEMQDAVKTALEVLSAVGGTASHNGRSCDLDAPAQHLTVSQVIMDRFGFHLLDTIHPAESLDPDPQPLGQALAPHGISLGPGASWQDYLHAALLSGPEAELGNGHPTVVTGYPRCMGALAATSRDDARCADRFEIYVCGVELANGYRELIDPDELRARMEVWSHGDTPQPSGFLEAMQRGLRPCAGVALGFDRLLMLSLGAETVKDVQLPPGPVS